MFLTLSDVLTAKSLATTRATALLTWVQCAKSVAKVITTILPVNAKIKHSVSIAAKITCLYLDFDWSVCEDQHGRDHFPIVIESIKTSEEDHNPKWKLNKANWDLFHTLCDESLTATSLSDSTDCIADFTSSLIDISEECIPKTSINPKKSNPWYNDDCKEAIKQRKYTLSRFCKFPTKDNLNTYRVFRAIARRTIKSSKRKSWRTYVSNLNYKTPKRKFGIWQERYLENLKLQAINTLIQISTEVRKQKQPPK